MEYLVLVLLLYMLRGTKNLSFILMSIYSASFHYVLALCQARVWLLGPVVPEPTLGSFGGESDHQQRTVLEADNCHGGPCVENNVGDQVGSYFFWSANLGTCEHRVMRLGLFSTLTIDLKGSSKLVLGVVPDVSEH